ncbi:MAG: hypothetical protein KME01_09385 [Chroococcus sp. CMT-3BRIN-NPC107]|nr:hypothetical protein [Chroococcus sp. CMT-3BRIN-NPC107]
MRFIFCPQASKTNQRQNKHQSDFRRSLTNITQVAALSLVVIGLGLSTPQTAQAETARIDDITIDRQPDETYDSLIQRAEAAARTALQQGFDRGSQITDVSVIILGQNQGVIAPVLSVGVSRPQRNGGSDGFTYFNSARSLLRLDEQQLATVDSPQPPGTTPRVPSRPQRNNSNSPGSARELINSTPVQPINPPPGAAPLPGSPALVPRPQAPGITPVTSPGDNLNTPPPPATPVTAPTLQNLPQVSPTTNPTPNLP